MSIDNAVARLIALRLPLVCFFVFAFLIRRLRRSRRLRSRSRFGFFPNAGGLGNAFQQLQAIVQPQVQHVLEAKLDEESDEDDQGGPLDPVEHLHRQARRIRRGDTLDRLTAVLPPSPPQIP